MPSSYGNAVETLNELGPPTKRAAFSDRMALLLAHLSQLAYVEFDKPEEADRAKQTELDRVIENILNADSDVARRTALLDFTDKSDTVDFGPTDGELERSLDAIGLELVKKYDDRGVDIQAFLARRPHSGEQDKDGFAVLSFRGTTQNIADWKTNLDIEKTALGTGKVHKGFLTAFRAIEKIVRGDVAKLSAGGYPIYLTGHSMGGALAIIATKLIADDSTGACYTFGSPRVGTYGFDDKIKTPIYRIVNANDVVPRIPSSHIAHILSFVISLIPIPGQKFIIRQLEKMANYVHHGDMRYLKRAKPGADGKYGVVVMESNPNMLHRLVWFFQGLLKNFKSPIEDHSIDTYRAKLVAWTIWRNEEE